MAQEAIDTNITGIPCKRHCRTIHASAPLQAVSTVFAGLRSPSILGGNTAIAGAEGFSYWAAEPREVFEFTSNQEAPFGRLQALFDRYEIQASPLTARGIYTGRIGFIGLDGTVGLNIAIRTVIIAAHKAFVQTGGGIVADSDPEAQWEETITKARAVLAGIEAVQEPQTKWVVSTIGSYV